MTVSLSDETYRDKVLGCWAGKNAGGTLGAPLETSYGKPEPFDVWWYPRLEEGGIPNDDLELQLIWLLALEEVGPALTVDDLVQYWIDYVGYNWDEYGFHRTNLRFGLCPPVSSASNNWFRDCMGSPIRSEIWACVAPGHPRVAVRYAYEDAIIDHAGGEGVFGELFNTAIQAAAFVLDDPRTLIDIGLTYVPDDSRTAVAVRAALEAHAAGVDWLEARRRVMQATPHYNTQYAPLNMGFQVIGWLYGGDFGDAICKAVNCGYDTDCTGATLGSYLGIVQGHAALPKKWLEPLGDVIATNASWGGLRNLEKAHRPFPATTTELTDRTIAVAQRVLDHHGISRANIPCDPEDLKADAAAKKLWAANPWRIDRDLGSVRVAVEYPKSATIAIGESKAIRVHLENPHPSTIELAAELRGTPALEARDPAKHIVLAPRSAVTTVWNVAATPALGPSNRLDLALSIKERPALPSLPIVLVGAMRWQVSEVFPFDGRTDREMFDAVLAPETASPDAGPWRAANAESNDVPFPEPVTAPGAIFARTFSLNPFGRPVRLGVPVNVPVKVWLNGRLVSEVFVYRPYRPNYAGVFDEMPIAYVNTEFRSGWNEILLKFVRGDSAITPSGAPLEAGLILADPTDQCAGLVDQVRCRFPWE